MVLERLGKLVEHVVRVEFGVDVHQRVGGVQIEVEAEANGGSVERLSERKVFEKRGGFEEGREDVAVGADPGSAHEVEGGKGVTEEAVSDVAFDDAEPCEGVRMRRCSGLHDLRVELFGLAR